MMMEAEWISQQRKRVLERFSHVLLQEGDSWPPSMAKAYEYLLLGKSKLLRPLLVYAMCQSFGQTVVLADVAACAVEWVHAYSLIYDDLPELDDAKERRGRPSFHCKFGQANAILFGCVLQALAFHQIAQVDYYSPRQKKAMIEVLSRAMGAGGMVGGQWLEFNELVRSVPSEHLVKQYHQRKTGALISASVALGAFAAGQEDPLSPVVDHIGHALGWAFQIQDDLFDFLEDDKSKQSKLCNWAHLHGVNEAYEDFQHQCALAKEAIRQLPEPRFMMMLVDVFVSLGKEAHAHACQVQDEVIEA